MTKTASRPPPTAGAQMPAGPGSLLGRDEELAELARLLDAHRLVTLTGPPGIGKTRLGVELVERVGGRFRGGPRVVELAPLARPVDVARAVASALSVEEVAGQDLSEAIVARVGRRRVLLALDNCEHLLGACAKLVGSLLSGCRELRIVATSREPLGIAKECVWQVPPLAVPEPDEDVTPEALARYPGVALFVQRAGAAKPGFSLNAYVGPAVGEICRRLDGIPLAIELAGARVESLTPEEIAWRLDERFALLTKGASSEVPRHQTLEAALDWSHELLSVPERTLLRRLSVFVAGFELEAAEAVGAGGEVEAGQVGDLLRRLVAKSLVALDPGKSSPARYRLLVTLRAYAAERLEEAGETATTREAHAHYYLALAELAEPELTGPDQQRRLERLEVERADLRAAIKWSLGHGQIECGLRLAGALVLFWQIRSHFREGRELLDAAVLAADGAAAAPVAKVLWGAGLMALMADDIDGAIPPLEQSLERFRGLGDVQGCARSLLALGSCMQLRDDPSLFSLLEESAALARDAGDAWCLSHALGLVGLANSYRDALSAARPPLEECLAVARAANDKVGVRWGLIGLGLVCVRQGDYDRAEPLLHEATAVTAELGDAYGKAMALKYLGELSLGRGDYRRATELVEEALDFFARSGPQRAHLQSLILLAQVAHAKGNHPDARVLLDEALALGRATEGAPVTALLGLGKLAAGEGDTGVARHLFEEALALALARDRKLCAADALHGLGQLARAAGEAKRAAALHGEALELRRVAGAQAEVVASLEALAGLAAETDAHEHSARLFGAAQALRETNGYARSPSESSRYEADLALAREALGTEELQRALGEGAGLSIGEAVAEAAGASGHGWSSLTEREQEVAALVAGGLTNPDIGERLFISSETVKTHLSHIFEKLGIKGRTELAAEVRRRDGR